MSCAGTAVESEVLQLDETMATGICSSPMQLSILISHLVTTAYTIAAQYLQPESPQCRLQHDLTVPLSLTRCCTHLSPLCHTHLNNLQRLVVMQLKHAIPTTIKSNALLKRVTSQNTPSGLRKEHRMRIRCCLEGK